jgi:hypothetical protein
MSGGFLTTLRPWSPPGPVAQAAFQSWGPVILIMGPPGSGKTGMLIWKPVAGAFMQNPYPDGVRRARLWVIAIDYRRLWGSFIPSWFEWLPQHDPDNGIVWVGPRGGPALQTISMKSPAGEVVVLEVMFEAVGDDWSEEAIEAFVAGKQATWALLNEWQNMPRILWDKLGPRVGRFPRAADAKVVGPGIWGDLNAGVVESWQHLLCTGGARKRGVHLFEQPGAFDLDSGGNRIAENLKNLPPGYYEQMMLTMPAHEIERKIHNRWGRRLDGEPVFNFDDRALVADLPLKPDYRRTLLFGVDAGLDPAIVFGQRMADGQLRRLAEVVAVVHGVGPKRFGEQVAALLASPRFAPFLVAKNIRGYGDPAAFHGNDKEDPDDAHWMDRFAQAAGLTGDMRPRPAPTNLPTPRQQAVRDTLVVEEGVPRGLFDPEHVPNLRRAYNGAYRYRKLRVVGAERYDPEPDKGPASHVADADQYLALLEGGYERAIGRSHNDGNAVLDLMRERGLIGGGEDGRGRKPRAPLIIT